MEDLISVIINVYNSEKYINKCLESIINQTYRNLEILIVNDGSTDNTLKICESYKDSRIKIINQKNLGISLSRNVGIENTKGSYLFFVDSDDFVQNDMIEYLYNLCKNYKVPLSVCKSMDIYDYNFKVKKREENIKIISGLDFIKKILLSEDRSGNVWNKLIKRELFDNIRFENRIIDDVPIIYKLVINIDKIACSNQIKYYYFRHNDSILGSKNEDYEIDLYKASIERYIYIDKIYPDLIENKIGLITIIMTLFLHNKEKLQKFLEKEHAIKLAKELFSIKIITYKISLKEKVKIVLFRINPNLYKKITDIYLKFKKI